MSRPYIAAFIVPKEVKALLTGDGWEFFGNDRIDDEAIDFLANECGLGQKSSYQAVSVFEGSLGKASVMRDEVGRIESIFFQLNDKNLIRLKTVYRTSRISSRTRLFIPSSEDV